MVERAYIRRRVEGYFDITMLKIMEKIATQAKGIIRSIPASV